MCVRATVANREARNLPYLPAFTTLPIVRVGSYLCDNSNNTKCEKSMLPIFFFFFSFSFPSLHLTCYLSAMECRVNAD